MAFNHFFTRLKDVPTEQWQELCEKVIEIFPHLPHADTRQEFGKYPLEICTRSGRVKINNPQKLFVSEARVKCIQFNGSSKQQLHARPFMLRPKGFQSTWESHCPTEYKPYDWLVTAVLILAHNICVDCFNISAIGEADAIPVLHWLNQVLGTSYSAPY